MAHEGTCWDVLAHWEDMHKVEYAPTCKVPVHADCVEPPSLTLKFSHPFDAHLGCKVVNVDVHVLCNSTLPSKDDPSAVGKQTPGVCDWSIQVETADPSVCKPAVTGGVRWG